MHKQKCRYTHIYMSIYIHSPHMHRLPFQNSISTNLHPRLILEQSDSSIISSCQPPSVSSSPCLSLRTLIENDPSVLGGVKSGRRHPLFHIEPTKKCQNCSAGNTGINWTPLWRVGWASSLKYKLSIQSDSYISWRFPMAP